MRLRKAVIVLDRLVLYHTLLLNGRAVHNTEGQLTGLYSDSSHFPQPTFLITSTCLA